MSATFVLRGTGYEVDENQTIGAALKSVDLQPELHLAVLDGELVTEDRIVKEGETYRIVAVVSGGVL